MKNITNKNLIIFGLLTAFVFSTAVTPIKASAHFHGRSFTASSGVESTIIPNPNPVVVTPNNTSTTLDTNTNLNVNTTNIYVAPTPIIGSLIFNSTETQETNSKNYSGYWNFDTNIDTSSSTGNPGNGNLRFNSATLSNVKEITINDIDADTNKMDSFLDNLSNGGNYGLIKIFSKDNLTTKFWYGKITAVKDQGDFHSLEVTFMGSAGSLFNDGEDIEFSFQPSGNTGITQTTDTTTSYKCSENQNITITGQNFIRNSVAKWDGSPRVTTYINSTNLVMQPTNTDFCDFGKHLITVDNGEYNGGLSNGVYLTVNKTEKSSFNLSANALSSGFMPSNLFEWFILFLIILLIIILIRKMFFNKNKNITLQVLNLTSTSVTLGATGLVPNSIYVLELIGAFGLNKVQVVATKEGTANATFTNLASASHYTATIKKNDIKTGLLTNIPNAPVVYFDTLK